MPAILEYIPYRKRDFTRSRDERMHPYVAGHGYAVARVDLRGTGESEGVLTGEYTEQDLADGELPGDQRPDDGRSLTFDSAPLDEPLELLGAPVVELALTADRPTAMVAVRLCEVLPDGASARLTYGLLNLTHRTSYADPTPLTPGKRTRARVQLNDCAQSVPAGHRLRVAISTNYWPLA